MAEHVHVIEVQRVDERRQARAVVGDPELRRRVGGRAAARSVPRDQRLGVGQRIQLSSPEAAIADQAVQQEERRTRAAALEGDAKPCDVDLVHATLPSR